MLDERRNGKDVCSWPAGTTVVVMASPSPGRAEAARRRWAATAADKRHDLTALLAAAEAAGLKVELNEVSSS